MPPDPSEPRTSNRFSSAALAPNAMVAGYQRPRFATIDAMASRSRIRSLPFRHNLKPGLGFEIFRLSDLYRRSDRQPLEHGLEIPQRPEFHTIYVGLRGRGRHVVDFAPCALGAGRLTVVARGRVQQFVPDRSLDAWMLLFSPEFGGASTVLSPSWTDPSLPLAGDAERDVLALCAQLEAEQARPLDAVQAPLLEALLRAVLLHAERLAARAVGHAPPSEAVERFYAALERDHAATRSVAHYARAAGVSPRRLAELFAARG